MRILALEPFYGGSHKAFLDGLKLHSKHDWTILGLPPHKWKWRMRHAPLTFAEEVKKLQSEKFDILFTSDMLNLSEFKGLASRQVSELPSIAYFHENQLTYPVQNEKERDYHFAFSNFVTCKSADAVWFNSRFHRDSFLKALELFLKRMPDYNSVEEIEFIRDKSSVLYPGIEPPGHIRTGKNEVPHILWNARWEFDKNPELFFEALFRLQDEGYRFRLSVLGEQFENRPAIFDKAKELLKEKIIHFGYLPSKNDYRNVLSDADFVVSTADHEFYGIAILEAASYGCIPILPDRLSYPEIFHKDKNPDLFYGGSLDSLCTILKQNLDNFRDLCHSADKMNFLKDYYWENIGNQFDTSIEQLFKF